MNRFEVNSGITMQPSLKPITATDILIAEPDSAVTDSLAVLFETAGYQIRTTHSPEELRRLVEELNPRCLILDAELPPANGIEILIQLRKKGNDILTIVIADRGDIAEAVAAMRAGANDVLEKPLLGIQLLKRIKHLLNG